jgi:hypothetical protein
LVMHDMSDRTRRLRARSASRIRVAARFAL